MSRTDTTRVILGGLAAGLVINNVETTVNTVLVANTMEELLAARNIEPLRGAAAAGYILLAFALGILIVWLYAAIRPRYGPGPKTALRAGLAVWIAFYVLGVGSSWLIGFAPFHMYLHNLLCTLPMMVIADGSAAASMPRTTRSEPVVGGSGDAIDRIGSGASHPLHSRGVACIVPIVG